jgi:hypothetical protein
MLIKAKKFNKNFTIIVALQIIAALLLVGSTTRAAFLTNRRIIIDTPVASAITGYNISFNISTPAILGSIQFEFCDSPLMSLPCIPPPGMRIDNSVLSSQSGEVGFSIDPSSTDNKAILTRLASASLAVPVSYGFTSVTNPSTPNTTTYVRISTYASTDASGMITEGGAAAFSTSGIFGTTAYVPPLLYFCAGITVAANCSSTSGDSADFGELKDNQVASLSSQFAAATNDPTGYAIYALGTTMMSGNNILQRMATPNQSIAGLNQFGINLRINNNPSVGHDISGLGSGSIMPNYNTPDLYMFEPGAMVARATQATDYNVYTSTYITNISVNQPVGVYTTTITYLAVAQF